jgi:hypothetical protein
VQVDSTNQVVREDLSKLFILSDVKKTVVLSRMQKGEKLRALEYSWGVERMGLRRKDAIPENTDVKTFEGDDQKKLYNRTQKFWRNPAVSTEAERIIANVDDSRGRYNKQVKKKTEEQKRDVEARLLDEQDSQEDTGIKGSMFLGIGRVINNVNLTTGALAYGDALTAIPAEYQTPVEQIYTGTLADYDEAALTDQLQSRANNLGMLGEFSYFVGPKLKRHISDNFGNYRPDKEGYTVVLRTTTQSVDKKKLMMSAIDYVDTEWGVLDITLAFFMPHPEYGYGLDMEQLMMRPGFWCEHEELPYTGSGRKGLIESILGYEFGDPRAHIATKPSDSTAPTGEGVA